MGAPPVIVVAGPTASGKSGLALRLAERLDGTIVNADAIQVYRDLRVLTARPGKDEEARVPHRLYGHLDAAERCSAADWARAALAEIAAIRAAGRQPIVVGGTGLYLRTLTEGIAPVPDIPDEVRTRARARHAEVGGVAFHNALARRDPEMAERLHPGDSQRVIRAWEVIEATGRSLADWQREPVSPPDIAFRLAVLLPPREELYATCDSRLIDMVAGGALDEVRALHARARAEALDPALPIFKAVGYPQLASHIEGGQPLDAAVAGAQQHTRNYAKRQYTWLRHQVEESGEDTGRVRTLKLSYVNMDKLFSFLS